MLGCMLNLMDSKVTFKGEPFVTFFTLEFHFFMQVYMLM